MTLLACMLSLTPPVNITYRGKHHPLAWKPYPGQNTDGPCTNCVQLSVGMASTRVLSIPQPLLPGKRGYGAEVRSGETRDDVVITAPRVTLRYSTVTNTMTRGTAAFCLTKRERRDHVLHGLPRLVGTGSRISGTVRGDRHHLA